MNRPAKNLRYLLEPRSIAVVGASESVGAGRNVIENLRLIGYSGAIYPVNPKRQTVLGLNCYPSLDAVPGEVDCVALTVGAQQLIPILNESGAKGIKAAWAFASGFAEAGPAGKELQRQLAKTCERLGIAFCGPNCVGYVNVNGQAAAFSAPLNDKLVGGRIGAVVQSGSVCLALTNANRGLGFSKIISSGNEAVLDLTDYIAYLLDDPDSEVITAFVEGFRKPERLAELAGRSREMNKPIIVLKVGRSGLAQRATAAHTGALTGSDKVQDAFFRQHGIIRVDDLDEMFETAELLLRTKANLPGSDRLGMVTVSGGEIGLIGDVADGMELKFPPLSPAGVVELAKVLPPYTNINNPLDAWGSGDLRESYPRCMEIMAREPEVDLVAVSLDATGDLSAGQSDQWADVARAAVKVKQAVGKEIVVFSNLCGGFDPQIKGILDQAAIPFLQGTRASLKAIKQLFAYSQARRRAKSLPMVAASPAAPELPALAGPKGRFLSESEAKAVLAAYGIRRPEEKVAASADVAMRIAAELGFPVALKIHSADIVHKTEAGGVALGLTDEADVAEAFARIMKNARRYAPEAKLDGVLVSRMISGQVAELIVGVSTDKDFGPAVVCGMGGIFVELFKDASLRLPPFDAATAAEMVGEIKGSALLRGFRGQQEGDIEALVDVLVKVGRLATECQGKIRALDINPLFVLPKGQGAIAIDSIIELR